MARSKAQRELVRAHQEIRDLKNKVYLMGLAAEDSGASVHRVMLERDAARKELADERNQKLHADVFDVGFVAKFAVAFLVELRKAGIANGKVPRG